MDHYAALGLSHVPLPMPYAAYRRLAKAFHPDVSTLPDAHQRFIRITEAYEVLSDPVKRSRYDMTPATAPAHGVPPRVKSRAMNAM